VAASPQGKIKMANIKGRCEPAYSIVTSFGGVTQTAKICGITLGAVSRWMSKDGGGGVIPTAHWKALLIYGRAHGIKITLTALSGIVL